jgi:hypothetical protein
MPESVPERWRLIRRFTENWEHISLTTKSDVELPPLTPNRFATEYPASLIEWFEFCHGLKLVGREHLFGDNIVTGTIPGHDAVLLILGGEGDVCWGVPYPELRSDDPAVHKFVLRTNSGDEVFIQACAVSDCLTEFVLLRIAYYIFPRAWIPSVPAAEETIQRMQWEFESYSRLGGLWIFESPDIATFVERDGTMIIGCQKFVEESDLPACIREVLW